MIKCDGSSAEIRLECEFCGESRVYAAYDAFGFGFEDTAGQSSWAACQKCAALIDEGDLNGLIERTATRIDFDTPKHSKESKCLSRALLQKGWQKLLRLRRLPGGFEEYARRKYLPGYKPGQKTPKSGDYVAIHERGHFPPTVVHYRSGEQFSPCDLCEENVRYQVNRARKRTPRQGAVVEIAILTKNGETFVCLGGGPLKPLLP